MRGSTLLLSFLSLATVSSATPTAKNPQPIGTAEGTLSAVSLLDVSRPGRLGLVEPVARARDGLIFYFLVTRKQPGTEYLSLKELRDFQVGPESYAAITKAELGATLEPQTIVEDVSDFFLRVRPDLYPLEALRRQREAYVVYTLVPGAKLPDGSRGTVTVRFGWGDQLESFSFRFSVPAPRR